MNDDKVSAPQTQQSADAADAAYAAYAAAYAAYAADTEKDLRVEILIKLLKEKEGVL